jgi:sucrose-6-phosphate hydrolase SacC (GH32 family)
MSLPRELTAGPDGELGMRVIPELSDLETNLTAIPDQSVSSGQRRIALQQMHIENLSAEIRLRILPKEFRVVLTDGQRPFLTIGYDPKNAGKEWVINGREAQLEASENSNIEFRIFLDGSVVEAMANDRVALTVRDYTLPRGPLWFEISEPHLDNTISLQVARLQPISSDRLTT